MKRPQVASFARRLSQNIKGRISRMSRGARIVSGMALLICGVLGFLPILGFWMIPLGLLVLSTEFHWANRAHKSWLRLVDRIKTWRRNRKVKTGQSVSETIDPNTHADRKQK